MRLLIADGSMCSCSAARAMLRVLADGDEQAQRLQVEVAHGVDDGSVTFRIGIAARSEIPLVRLGRNA